MTNNDDPKYAELYERYVDVVVIYDRMRWAANQVVSIYAQRVTVGGVDDPAIIEIRKVRAEVRAVDIDDLRGQIDLRESLWDRYFEMTGKTRPTPPSE